MVLRLFWFTNLYHTIVDINIISVYLQTLFKSPSTLIYILFNIWTMPYYSINTPKCEMRDFYILFFIRMTRDKCLFNFCFCLCKSYMVLYLIHMQCTIYYLSFKGNSYYIYLIKELMGVNFLCQNKFIIYMNFKMKILPTGFEK